ncbi:hypothetical protein QFC24_007110 [Naganishia onofrii]|uniref:Uncharacterized protein n=1 Tax=Naganishia onofrii TaxID=1851511 RepID=A0ACC2WVF1_9TREE|nr:hypothetical protein QFC24_007110 [Naganishia onofrii]
MNNSKNASLLLNATESLAVDANPAFFPTGLGALGTVYHLLTHPKIKDWVQLIMLGLLAEMTRRISKNVWIWANDCEVNASSGSSRLRPWLDRKKKKSTIRDKKAPPKPHFIPNLGESHTIWLGQTMVRLHRKINKEACWYYDKEVLEVTMLTRSRQRFEDLLVAAKAAYLIDDEEKITVKMVDEEKNSGDWRQVATKNKRPLSSVVTEAGVKERLERDIIEFLKSENWYISRGVPWRRGFLLHGVPGCGKTSLIHALASACDLDIYVVSLATQGLTDSKLNRCMTAAPAGSVIVMEDIDVGMPDGSLTLNRQDGEDENEDEDEDDASESSDKRKNKKNKGAARGGGVTLSGLLNAIDGVAGSEGRILFMTTNHIEKLDHALIRPGRADIHVEFKNASKAICRDLFKVFYPVTGEFPVKYARSSDVPLSFSAVNEKEAGQLTEKDIGSLADAFMTALPEGEFSPAQIQGTRLPLSCLGYKKVYPGEAVDAVPAWIEEKRKEKADAEKKKEEAAEAKRLREEERAKKRAEKDTKSETNDNVQEVSAPAIDNKETQTPKAEPDSLPATTASEDRAE